jgi:hypothetical protein
VIIILPNGKQLRGDLILSAVLRSDLTPIPVTLHAKIRVDDDLKKMLSEGQVITAAGDRFYIVKSILPNARMSQGEHEVAYIEIFAYLDSVHTAGFVLKTALLKEKTTLQAIYRATGATLKAIENDLNVARFYCLAGNFPTVDIAKTLQDESAVVSWKNGKMRLFRVQDLMRQKPVLSLANNSMKDFDSGFLERHEIPTFYSIDANGVFIYGNKSKIRTAVFAPNKDVRQLQNMGRVLVKRKETNKIAFDLRICAGDVIDVQGIGQYAVITAAHVFEPEQQYTKLWLGQVVN